MARLSISGFQITEGAGDDDLGVAPQVLRMNFPAGVNSLIYEYVPETGAIAISTPLPTTATIDGVNVRPADYYVGQVSWGTMSTTFLQVDMQSGGHNFFFLTALDGSAFPDFSGPGAFDLWTEFKLLPTYFGPVDSGPFRPGQSIGFDELENPTLNDSLRQGNQNANAISGTGRADAIIGMGGNDNLSGRGGEDTILSGKGNDVAHGGLGGDVILGFGGNDRLFGDGGQDSLVGGKGTNVLTGGAGDDDFVFLGGAEVATIKDFAAGDQLALDVALWDDVAFTARQVVTLFGSVENGQVVLDFGDEAGTTRIVIEDLASLQGLHRHIFIIDEG